MGQALEVYKVLGQRVGTLSGLVYSISSETVTGQNSIQWSLPRRWHLYQSNLGLSWKRNHRWLHFLLWYHYQKLFRIANTPAADPALGNNRQRWRSVREYHCLSHQFRRTVDGEGVVGNRPVLAPGEQFRYQSYSDQKTLVGTMVRFCSVSS